MSKNKFNLLIDSYNRLSKAKFEPNPYGINKDTVIYQSKEYPLKTFICDCEDCIERFGEPIAIDEECFTDIDVFDELELFEELCSKTREKERKRK